MLNLIKLLIYFLLTNYICVAAFASIDGKIIFYSSLGRKSLLWIDNRGEVWEQSQRQGGTEDEATKSRVLEFGSSKILYLSSAQTHALALDSEGRVWGWGENSSGQLGLGGIVSETQPVVIPTLKNIVAVETGLCVSFVLDADAKVYTFGTDVSSTQALRRILVPTQVIGLPAIREIAVGREHILALDYDGNVWSWGDNYFGQTGSPIEQKVVAAPTKIPNLPAIDQVRARDTKSLLVDVNQEIWVFGSLSHPSFGISSYQSTPQKIPGLVAKTVAIFENGGAGLLTDGAFFCWDCQAHHPYKLAELHNVPLKAVTNLREGFAILSEDNQVKYWGLKTPYQPYELQTLEQIPQGAFASRTPVKSARK